MSKFRIPGSHGGASCWLIISALLFRIQFDLEAVAWRDAITGAMPEKKKRNLHFAELNHGQKLLAAKHIGSLPVRAISILDYKCAIPDNIYHERNQLYFYVTRHLIERISWLCRDMRPRAPEGDGRVKIVFSRRGGMQYGDFQNYLLHLRTSDAPVQIHWPVVDIDGIEALDHSKRAGLQLADTIASAVANGIEPDRYGNCECRYAELLKPIIYHRNQNYLSYGLKFLPRHEEIALTADQKRLVKLFK